MIDKIVERIIEATLVAELDSSKWYVSLGPMTHASVVAHCMDRDMMSLVPLLSQDDDGTYRVLNFQIRPTAMVPEAFVVTRPFREQQLQSAA